MSVSGISSSSFPDFQAQGSQNNFQQLQQEFQQLGQDLQSGNLSAAQSDFATLQSLEQQGNSTSSSESNNPIAQAFNQLKQDLQSGNISSAQQDYASIQQALQNQAPQGHHHHHRHPGGGKSEQSAFGQILQQLGQALQSGNLTAAQQAYSTLQQDFQQVGQANGQPVQPSSTSSSSSNSVSVNA